MGVPGLESLKNDDDVEMNQTSIDVAIENNDHKMELEEQKNSTKQEQEKNESNQQKGDNLIIQQQQNASHWGAMEDAEMSKPQAKKFSPY